MTFEISEINNGWLLCFHSETGYHRFFFEDFNDATKIMKDVIEQKKSIKG